MKHAHPNGSWVGGGVIKTETELIEDKEEEKRQKKGWTKPG